MTKLIAIKFLRGFAGYHEGEVAGFAPDVAKDYVEDRKPPAAEYVKQPKSAPAPKPMAAESTPSNKRKKKSDK